MLIIVVGVIQILNYNLLTSDFLQTPQSVCSESCSPGFRKLLPEGNVAYCFDCPLYPENEISNETGKCVLFKNSLLLINSIFMKYLTFVFQTLYTLSCSPSLRY